MAVSEVDDVKNVIGSDSVIKKETRLLFELSSKMKILENSLWLLLNESSTTCISPSWNYGVSGL